MKIFVVLIVYITVQSLAYGDENNNDPSYGDNSYNQPGEINPPPYVPDPNQPNLSPNFEQNNDQVQRSGDSSLNPEFINR